LPPGYEAARMVPLRSISALGVATLARKVLAAAGDSPRDR
jgi:hypothetical protein